LTAPAPAQAPVLNHLSTLSSAEEFFAFLGVDYDPKVVSVVRLHILRRMGQYLKGEDFGGLSDAVVEERCKAVLQQAYQDFLASTPMQERVFKVLKDAVAPPKKQTSFVQLDTLK